MDDRIVEVNWNTNNNKRYLTCILIYTNDEKNHMLDLVQTISTYNVSVDGIKIMDQNTYEITCYVSGLEQLEKLIVTLDRNKYVDKIEREMR